MSVGQFSLMGKTIVVTGGGSGISLAFARLAAAQDAKILIADLRLTPEAEDFVKSSSNVVFVECDVVRWNELEKFIKLSEEKFGDVPDVYVAGAGVHEPEWSNFWTDSETERYAELDINVSHPVKLTRIAIRSLLSRNKHGVVLILSSMGGLHGSYPSPLYTASKHALVGFTKSMAQADEDERVKVVCLCPTFVDTPLWTNAPSKMEQFSYSPTLALTAESVAETMVQLIEESKYPGGTILQVTLEGNEAAESKQVWESARAPPDLLRAAVQKSYGPVRAILKAERDDDKGSS